ncbi:MAG: hypothetical protein KJ795_07470 [Gammaproteobacteria bacterium]|nr:hypothetical protein [Gammaproteobacteria bacterium]MBU1777136.1 hypothetical protein [Gammaproteobacteria bacterium]MBU1969825.1 hypothetical protein [Gammaproteobacteria bacterium]
MKIGNIYSASDKALFDALCQGNVTSADIRRLFLTHGIIISRSTNRRELAAHFSRLVHDYDDFQALAKLFDAGHRRERLASLRVTSTAQLADYESAALEIVAQLKSNTDAASVSKNDDGSIRIAIRYKTFHFNKSEFRQIETRDAIITIEKDGGTAVIRGPQNDKVDEVCRAILTTIKEKVDDKLDITEINLEHFREPMQRTTFFVQMIDLVHGYKKHDVTDVYFYKPKDEKAKEQDEDDGSTESEDDINLGIRITSGMLKGEGVLASQEMSNFISRGFYISKIVWQAKVAGEFDSDIYEFEAQFSEPETCTRFSYLVRGHYKYQEDQKHSNTRTQLASDEDVELSKAIETAARTSLNKLEIAAGVANND